jgi:hypothetical protein
MRGHKFFADPTGRIALADWSGDTPDQTDDGVLWLDPKRPIRINLEGERLHAFIPLLDRHGKQTYTVSDIRTADFAQKMGKMTVKVSSTDLLVLVNMVEDSRALEGQQ